MLNATQPILPLRLGIPERQTHDYFRQGMDSENIDNIIYKIYGLNAQEIKFIDSALILT